MKIRPAKGMGATLDEVMQHVSVVRDRAELLAYLREHYAFWEPTDENVTIRHYCYDGRIGWDTHLVSVAGNAALFSDGPLPEDTTR